METPTSDELDHLRETKNLFKSNLLKLEIEELLGEVTVVCSKKRTAAIKECLFEIKERIENTPKQDGVQGKTSGWEGKKVVLDFEPPVDVQIVGSYMLDTVTKPSRNVDVAVKMPSSCFKAKDYLNHRYFDKRFLYLSVLKKSLKSLGKVSIVDNRIELKSRCGFIIRIMAVIGDDVFSVHRFGPGKGNARMKSRFESSVEGEHILPTPYYNMSLMMDIERSSYKRHLTLFHDVSNECKSFREVCVLLKVWARVRSFEHVEFVLCMLLAHLILERHIHVNMSVQQTFRSMMEYLQKEKSVWRVCPGFGERAVVHEGFENDALSRAFPVVLMGPCGRLNVAYRLSHSDWEAVRAEAGLSHRLLDGATVEGGRDAFEAVFTTKISIWHQFDKYFCVECPKEPKMFGDEKALVDLPWTVYLKRRTEEILLRAFVDTKRAVRLRVVSYKNKLLVCLRIDRAHAFGVITKGPSAENASEAASFRAFWGKKSELRRFQDGSIVETLDWTSSKSVCEDIASYVLETQWPFSTIEQSPAVGMELESLLPTTDDKQASQAFDVLAKRVRAIDLPLSVTGVEAADPALRGSSIFGPQEHALLVGKKRRRVSRLVNAIHVVLQLESSGKWPDDPRAIEAMKTGLYVEIARKLQRNFSVVAFRHGVDVCVDGFAFRCVFRVDRERKLLSEPQGAWSTSKVAANKLHKTEWSKAQQLEKGAQLELETVRRPLLHSQLAAVHTGVMGPVIRLAKTWLSGHLLYPHISEEAIELCVACVFLHPQPFDTPRSVTCGFLRFLQLIATWDWENAPLIVNPGEELSTETFSAITSRFLKTREVNGGAHMYIVTPDDYNWTTRSKPDLPVLKRMVKLAKGSLELLEEFLLNQGMWQAMFMSSVDKNAGFDGVINLFHQDKTTKVYANVSASALIGYRPAVVLFQKLEKELSHFFNFYYDPLNPTRIAFSWKTGALDPVPLRVAVAGFAMPVADDKVAPNVAEVLSSIKLLGGDLIDTIITF